METTTTTANKPSNNAPGSKIPAATIDDGVLLARANFGMHVTGRVDSISEVQHRKGTSSKGSPYSFYQQSATLTLGGSMVEVVARADEEPKSPLLKFELDEAVRLKVENPRIFNGKVSFDLL